MYVNPFIFGIVVGVIGTLIILFLILCGFYISTKGKGVDHHE